MVTFEFLPLNFFKRLTITTMSDNGTPSLLYKGTHNTLKKFAAGRLCVICSAHLFTGLVTSDSSLIIANESTELHPLRMDASLE